MDKEKICLFQQPESDHMHKETQLFLLRSFSQPSAQSVPNKTQSFMMGQSWVMYLGIVRVL